MEDYCTTRGRTKAASEFVHGGLKNAITESSYRYWIEIRVAAGTVKAAQLDMPLFLPHMNKHVGVKIM